MITRPPTTRLAKARLAGEILATAVRAKRAVRGDDAQGAVRALRDDELEVSGVPLSVGDAAGFGYAVHRTLTLVRARCLVQSLALLGVLARRGTRATLVIGVRPGDAFGAHAWVEVDSHAVLPHGAAGFARVVEL